MSTKPSQSPGARGKASPYRTTVVRRRPVPASVGGFVSALCVLWLLQCTRTFAWGPAAHRLVNNSAVDTLPPALRPFFEANRRFLVDHANDPDEWIKKDPYERTRHYIYLDKYGLFPYLSLPYSYKAAVAKYGSRRLNRDGLLPWRIGEYSLRLTNDLRAGKWEEAKLDAAALAHYVADAHDPLSTTENYDGQLTQQTGLATRFGSGLIERYTNFFMVHPEEAAKIDDPTAYAFQMALEANTWVDRILWADWLSRAGRFDYTDEYFDRFYSEVGSAAMQEINGAAHDAGSYWYTSWLNAGSPALPH
jgi:hypothetical protein